ncbi:AraC-type DNA-binding protein [Pseudomonas cuatrocienegasensis]|uniref:AraC-type DNA-binding protein n=1 Tax=Pseudomonas cuatrocienegasensis TaxID=543360 RepID=A0ABY1B8P7_9PSED|nr:MULTISPECIES: AraC family transcriptional regulator [Pseudomonas]OEC35750.1 regulator [Pseudomonas sp. 21C1]SEQ22562.1 AraC-type DNA-binding protein [Pseudomonas cuatrocienegasensis]
MDWRQKRTLTGVRYLLQTAQEEGIDAPSCLKGSAIAAADLQSAGAQIEAWQELAVIRNVLGYSNRPGLGFLTGQRYHLTSLGMLGFTMLASRTLSDAFALFSRFQLIALTLCPTRLERDRRGMWLLFDASVLPRDTCAFIVERGLAACLQISSELLKRQVAPLAIEMTAPGPGSQAVSQPLFPYALRFSAQRDGILFSQSELNCPLPQAHVDAQLQGEQLCELQYQEVSHQLATAPIARQVQILLIGHPEKLLSCRAVAERLGLSERTLHRRLVGEGHSFQQLNEQIKKQLAKHLLNDPRLSLNAIALRLGYAEAASFSRAFSRWTGSPPSHWQRQSLG